VFLSVQEICDVSKADEPHAENGLGSVPVIFVKEATDAETEIESSELLKSA